MKTKKVKKIKKATIQIDTDRLTKKVGFILLIPLLGNYFVAGWNWSLGDFIFASVMLFGTGYALEYAAQKIKDPTNRFIACAGIIAAFLLIWAELAVGIFD